MKAFDIQAVTKTYPGQSKAANNNITLQIEAGEIFGLLGDNGAGKSTLVKQMVNLLRSDSGSITCFGQDISQNSLYAPLRIGYMPQDGLALNNLTVSEAIYFTAHLRGLNRAEARRERDGLLKTWQIEAQQHQTVTKLSGGQKRLLQLAVTMAGSPPVLILDEPTNNLDPQRRKLVWDNLRHLNRSRGTTIVFITHDAIEAEKIIQRVGIMKDGELVALGRPAELKAQVDQKLRLELFFPPETPPTLPPDLHPHRLGAGRWLVYLGWNDTAAILNALNLNQPDDFRLYSATLEDLYLHYATQA